MKIYTKKGDRGTTSLFGGEPTGKDSLRVETYGTVDELNSIFGVIVAHINDSPIVQSHESICNTAAGSSDTSDNAIVGLETAPRQKEELTDIAEKLQREQRNLFMVGSDLATPAEASEALKDIIDSVDTNDVATLEREIDAWDQSLPTLNKFILPGGSHLAAHAHHARSICRRAERRVFTLSKQEQINADILIYLNRLSDWLFVLARRLNAILKFPEIERD